MKTISPVLEQEKLSTAETSNNHALSEISQEHVFNESDNLLVCNSDLVSSFQDVKSERSRLNPGHFIHKVFLHKLKSQSAPSLDKKKTTYSDGSAIPEESNDTASPLMNGQESVFEEEACKETNDSWFKTWPECGVDKCVVRNGKILEGISNGVHEPDVSRDKLGDSCSHTNTSEKGNLNVDIGICKQCNLQKCTCNANGSALKGHTPISLDNLLTSFPLAYSPVTKQIHIIKSNEPEICVNSNQVESTAECCDINQARSDKTLCRVSTEVSSFSSNVSSLSDISPSTNEDSVSGSLLDHGDNCSLVSIGNCSIISEDSVGAKPKRKGISGFFSRGVFGWKGKNESQCNGDGWSLFGRSNLTSSSRASSSLSVGKCSDDGQSAGEDSGRGVQGSTGLIQLERPDGLPAKTKQERQAHTDQHNKIIHSARKRELKEAKQRKKLLQVQLKAEDELAQATKVWTQEILPRWHQTKNQRRTQEMWWYGVPPCVRGRVWCFAIRNDLNITHELYEICVNRAQERLNSARGSTDSINDSSQDADKEASMELIQLDISRTFPHLCIFQKGGPYYDMLHCLLAAYVCYRPDVGYVQGMSFIAAILILNMDAPDAFICFANLLNRPCHRAFYSLDQPLMEGYYATYNELLRENLPVLCGHMEVSKLSPDLYLLDWLYTVFSKAMSLDLASRVWDVFLRDGEEFLFRTAIGVLHLYQECLLGMDFLSGSQFLTRLPDDLTAAQLFKSISSVRMTVSKRNFSQILASYTHPSG